MNKIKLNVVKQEKIDNRVNNTGRPVNLKSTMIVVVCMCIAVVIEVMAI